MYEATAAQLPRKCKNCQITIVQGTSNRVSAAVAGKVKAPAALASDSAAVADQHGATNAVAGTGNAPVQTNTAPAALGAGAVLAARLTGPLGYVVGLAGLALVGYGLWWIWPLLPRRRQRNPNPNS